MKRTQVLFLVLVVLIAVFISLNQKHFSMYEKNNFPIQAATVEERAITNKLTKGIDNVGTAPFGLNQTRFNREAYHNSIKPLKTWNIATVWNTFGPPSEKLIELMHNKKLKALEIHLINEPCQRNGRCGTYEFLYGVKSAWEYDSLLRKKDRKLLAKYKKYSMEVKRFLDKNLQPWTTCYISPGLESNIGNQAAKVLIKNTRRVFKNCKIIWNPLNGGYKLNADLLEQHGPAPMVKPPCVVNLDGTDINFPERRVDSNNPSFIEQAVVQDYIETYSLCELVFLWVGEYNCLGTGQPWKDPRARACPTNNVFNLVGEEAWLAQNHGKKVETNPFITPWTETENLSFKGCSKLEDPTDGDKRGFLLKSSHVVGRGGVLLFPGQYRFRSVTVESKGVAIDKYDYSGIYTPDKLNRQLWRSSKSPVDYPMHVVVKADKTCYKIDYPKMRVD